MPRKNLGNGVSIQYNLAALRKIRYGDEAPKVRGVDEKWAAKVAATANRMSGTDGYKVSSLAGRRKPQGRWRTTVITATAEAMLDNAKNNTLVKALYSTTGTSFTA